MPLDLCACWFAGGVLLSAPSAAQTTPPVARFVEETNLAGLQARFEGEAEFMVGSGVPDFDCDGDGLPEVYVTAGVSKVKFYGNRNARGGPIKLAEDRSGLELTHAIAAYTLDFDCDGNIDLLALRVGEGQFFQGFGNCRFKRANDSWRLRSGNSWHMAFAATGERGEMWPTLAIGTYLDHGRPVFPWGSCTPRMLISPATSGPGFAEPLPLALGHCALSMLFSDWSLTGEPALRVSNDREY